MKIVLVGPVYPYKGGISHYTCLMCRALRMRHEVVMVSFKMQYPRILFKKEQRDYQNRNFEIKDTQFLINTANPFNWMRSARRINRMNADVVVFQWWHPYFAPCYYFLSRLICRSKIMFVCHNVFPHERFPLDRLLCKMVLGQGDYFVTQSQSDQRDLIRIKPDARNIVTPHPTYNAFKMQNLSQEAARTSLGADVNVPMILFFGFVREYKGLKYLLKAMPIIIKEFPGLQLWVVGDFGDNRSEYTEIITEEGIENNIELVEGYIPDKEVERYFAAADLVVLPYISATQSGIIQIAYGFEKPVLVTDVGGLPDVVRDGETGYVVKSASASAIAEGVIRFFRSGLQVNWTENIRKLSDDFSWETMVERIEGKLWCEI